MEIVLHLYHSVATAGAVLLLAFPVAQRLRRLQLGPRRQFILGVVHDLVDQVLKY